MKIINASINLSKIDKAKVKSIDPKTGKPYANGAKYYNLTVIVKDEKDQYGNDVAIKQGQTKEERDAKTPEVYLGNGRTVYETKPSTSQSVDQNTGEIYNAVPVQGNNNEMDQLPF